MAWLLRSPLPRSRGSRSGHWLGVVLAILACVLMLAWVWWWRPTWLLPGTQPLVMNGGNPHIRALMRTISASESNVWRPYHVLHGGTYVEDIHLHPNHCSDIQQGPNRGNCSTAAGRYQLLYPTWLALAAKHHPLRGVPSADPATLSFEPMYQDAVVHAWLSDKKVWGMDLAAQLQQGRVRPVLRRLSGTWTSLGYGIETNLMSRELPRLYGKIVETELERAQQQASLP